MWFVTLFPYDGSETWFLVQSPVAKSRLKAPEGGGAFSGTFDDRHFGQTGRAILLKVGVDRSSTGVPLEGADG